MPTSEMSVPEALCEYCAKIPLDPQTLSATHMHGTEWNLGSGLRVKESGCPFCKLVELTVFEQGKLKASPPIALAEMPIVSVQWQLMGGQGNRGAFLVGDNDDFEHTICFGRDTNQGVASEDCYLRSFLEPKLDFEMVSAWISTCSTKHGNGCTISTPTSDSWSSSTSNSESLSSNAESPLPDAEPLLDLGPEFILVKDAIPGLDYLRLIDVQRNCLTKQCGMQTYVALSYVWGAATNFRLTKTNEPMLSESGAFNPKAESIYAWWTPYSMLPRTVREAIDLVRGLGLRYLWVDSLCLIQNDPKELEAGIAVMDRIYEHAWLTIAAAGGHDANAGLPGVRQDSRRGSQLCTEVAPNTRLGLFTTPDELLSHSVYRTRAWTFQEELVSRRVLYFIDDKIFFRCQEAQYAETCVDTRRLVGPTFFTSAPMIPIHSMLYPLEDLATVLGHYTQRALGNQGDALRAIAGLLRHFSERLKCGFLQGLPVAVFDLFILFMCSTSDIHLHRRSGFPSYSWAGWRGGIELELPTNKRNEWLALKTWIIWHVRNPAGDTAPVWDLSTNEWLPDHDHGSDYVGYKYRQPFQPPPLVTIDESNTQPSTYFDDGKPFPRPYPVLQFWTLAVYFNIEVRSTKRGVLEGIAGILNPDNNISCGSVSLDGFEEMPFFESLGPFEFILLSEDYGVSETETYNVMLLEWVDGVAERRGLGHLSKDAVHLSLDPGPIWKEILLA